MGRAYISGKKPPDPNWTTRPHEAALAVRVLGGSITTDPCSNANSIIPAQVQYTKKDDGLIQLWFGTVFINPPYDVENLRSFFAKGLAEFYRGHAEQLLYFVPANKTEQDWVHVFALQASAICFFRRRRPFDRPSTTNSVAPMATMFVYFGPDVDRFEAVMGPEGFVLRLSALQNLSAQVRMLMMLTMNKLEVPESAILAATAKGGLLALYESVKHLTVEEAVMTLKEAFDPSTTPKDVSKRSAKKTGKRRKATAAKAPATAKKTAKKRKSVAEPLEGTEKDVYDAVSDICDTSPIGARMKDLKEQLVMYSEQQIRRALRKMEKKSCILKEGSVSQTTYHLAA